DDETAVNVRNVSREIFGEPIGEVLLLGIIARRIQPASSLPRPSTTLRLLARSSRSGWRSWRAASRGSASAAPPASKLRSARIGSRWKAPVGVFDFIDTADRPPTPSARESARVPTQVGVGTSTKGGLDGVA